MICRGLGGAPYHKTVKGGLETIENAQLLVNDFQGRPETKRIVDEMMPSVLFSELPVEHAFANDKTSTNYRNLSMENYGRLKRPKIVTNIRKYCRVSFSKYSSRIQRYADPTASDIDAERVIESYEEVLSAEKQAFPLVKDAAMQERAREICSLANPPGARTVRDFHRPGCGYGQSALIAVDYGHKRGEQRSLFNLLAGLRYITDAKEGDIAMSDGEVCLSVGDLAVILNDNGFTLLRVSRPHPVTRCRPRCLVFGHALMETEEHVYVYDNVSQDESKACFGDLLLHDGAPVKVDRKLVDLTLEQGAIAVTLSEEMLSLIEDAVYDTKQQGDA